MARQVIAKVKLNPGKGGYFDPITRIHLTHGDSEKPVFAGMNTTNLRKAVHDKRIKITSGSLGEFTPPFKLMRNADGKVVLAPNTVEAKAETVKEEKKVVPEKKEDKKVENEVKETPIKEEVPVTPEPTVEEPVKEEAEVEVEETKVEEAETETEVKAEEPEPEAEAEIPEKEEEKAEETEEAPKKRRRKKNTK